MRHFLNGVTPKVVNQKKLQYDIQMKSWAKIRLFHQLEQTFGVKSGGIAFDGHIKNCVY